MSEFDAPIPNELRYHPDTDDYWWVAGVRHNVEYDDGIVKVISVGNYLYTGRHDKYKGSVYRVKKHTEGVIKHLIQRK